jgi:hypothetical protein
MTGRLGEIILHLIQWFSTTKPELDRTFVKAWHTGMRIHEAMAENRLRFSQRLNEMSEELASLAKEVDKNRKQVGKHTAWEGLPADARSRN